MIERRDNESKSITSNDIVDRSFGVLQQYVMVWNPDVNEEKAWIRQSMTEALVRKHMISLADVDIDSTDPIENRNSFPETADVSDQEVCDACSNA